MKTLKPFSAAVFDLDGTLLNSMGVWAEVDREFLQKRGFAVPPDYQAAIKSMSLTETAEYTIARFSLPETPQSLIGEWLDMAKTAYAESVELKPYAKEYLQKLHAGGVRLAVATSSAEELFLPALERNGIKELFSAFVTAHRVGRGKDYPDVYLEAARQIGAEPEHCAVFEDVVTAIGVARKAGFFTVAVQDSFSLHEADALRAAADCYIASYKELL